MENQNNQTNTKPDAMHGELIPGADLLEIEKERIKTTLRAIEANEANDLRLYQYHMAKLDQDAKDKPAPRGFLLTITSTTAQPKR